MYFYLLKWKSLKFTLDIFEIKLGFVNRWSLASTAIPNFKCYTTLFCANSSIEIQQGSENSMGVEQLNNITDQLWSSNAVMWGGLGERRSWGLAPLWLDSSAQLCSAPFCSALLCFALFCFALHCLLLSAVIPWHNWCFILCASAPAKEVQSSLERESVLPQLEENLLS